MRHADFVSPAARLEDAVARLEHAWQLTREHWSDPVSETVEEKYLVPIHNQVALMMYAVNKISEVMGRAERECSHKRELDSAL